MAPAPPSPAARVLGLQRAVGNAAVGRILARQPVLDDVPDLMDPFDEEDPVVEAQINADRAKLGGKLRERLIGTLTGPASVMFLSQLRALDGVSRRALREDAEFWRQLRTHVSRDALWAVELILEYGSRMPPEVVAMAAAIRERDAHRARTLIMGYEPLKRMPSIRDRIVARFPKAQADDLLAFLAEKGTRAESGMTHYKEAHYEGFQIKEFTGDRNYELVRLNTQLRVIVRINLSESENNKKTEITDKLIERWEGAISRTWNNRFRLKGPGGKALDVWFIPVFMMSDRSAHHQVTVTTGNDRSNEGSWHSEDAGGTAAHEFGHMLGNPDEYHLAATAAEIPAKHGLSAAETQRNTWEGLTGEKKRPDAAGYDVEALMGDHYKNSRLLVRYGQDVRDTFNAMLKLPGEADWTIELKP